MASLIDLWQCSLGCFSSLFLVLFLGFQDFKLHSKAQGTAVISVAPFMPLLTRPLARRGITVDQDASCNFLRLHFISRSPASARHLKFQDHSLYHD